MLKITKFITPTCSQCKTIVPMLEGMVDEGLIEVEELNALEHEELQEKYQFQSVPTIVFHEESGDIVRTGVREIMGYISTNVM